MDGNDNVVGYHQDFARFMEQGSVFFTRGMHVPAAHRFREARDVSILIHGESSCQCALARYDYGLSMLCQVPLLQNDPMDFLPKEVDYYKSLAQFDGSPSSTFKRYRGAMEEQDRKMLDDAKRELDLAWSIMENKPDEYDLGKAYILSALGEVAFRRGEGNPQHYYSEALAIFKRLYGEHNIRVADMYPYWFEFRNAKLFICLEGSNQSRAIQYGTEAWLFYDTLMVQLLSEIPSSSKIAVTQIDPSIQQKRKEANLMLRISTNLKDKLARLETVLSLQLN